METSLTALPPVHLIGFDSFTKKVNWNSFRPNVIKFWFLVGRILTRSLGQSSIPSAPEVLMFIVARKLAEFRVKVHRLWTGFRYFYVKPPDQWPVLYFFYEAMCKRQPSTKRLELEWPILRDTTGTDFINIRSFDSISFRMRREEEEELDINLINQDQYHR